MIENIGALNQKKPTEIDAIKMALDYMVQCQTAFFNFTPDNILQYIKFFMREGVSEQRGSQKISMVFENNIRNSILEACPTEGNANLHLLALEYLADNMYFVKQKEKIDITTFVKTKPLNTKPTLPFKKPITKGRDLCSTQHLPNL